MLGYVNFKRIVGGLGSSYKLYAKITDIACKILATLCWFAIVVDAFMLLGSPFNGGLAAAAYWGFRLAINFGGLIIIHLIAYIVARILAYQVRKADEKREALGPRDLWVCNNCHTQNELNFCVCCGAAKAVATRLIRPDAPLDGVWTCQSCGAQNSKNFGQCKNCGSLMGGVKVDRRYYSEKPEKPLELGENEWECAFCGHVNDNQFCIKCGKSKLNTDEANGKIWICKVCDSPNDVTHTQCRNCATLRNGTSTGIWEQKTEASIADTWKCSNCGTRNSNVHNQCQKCSAYRQ